MIKCKSMMPHLFVIVILSEITNPTYKLDGYMRNLEHSGLLRIILLL